MSPTTSGRGQRKCISWTESFVEATAALEAPVLFRKWAAISAIAGVLEQKVWITTSSHLYPNVYCFIIGHPGVGKTRVIRAIKGYLAEVPDFHFAPTSVTGASLVDSLVENKRTFMQLPLPPMEYNSMMITAEELTAFMHKYDDEMVGLLSAFYDPDPYAQSRRGKDLRIKIKSPQLNILSATTPSNLLKFLPEIAWDQGFTSRVVMIFSDERIIGDDFAKRRTEMNADMIHDLRMINTIAGEYRVTEEYRTAVNNWRKLKEPPVPTHPKLLHYATRRRVHLYKLSMIAAADRSNTLLLTTEDFNTAMGWLLEAEEMMPEIFKAGGIGADTKAMDEIYHYVLMEDKGSKGVPEHKIVNFARERVPAHSVMRVLEVMQRAEMIEAKSLDSVTGIRYWSAVVKGLTSLS